jgi:cytochrome c-type biogenesis protein CcmH
LKRWWVPWLGLAVVVVVAVVVLVARSGPSGAPGPRAARLENELACPVCTGESVADSNAPESRAIRLDVAKRIHAGQTDEQIRDAYVTIYGEHVLLTPSNGGLGVIAWGLPVIAIVLGAAGITIALRRSSRSPRLAATAADAEVVERQRHLADADEDAGEGE